MRDNQSQKQYQIPMAVTDETIKDYGINPADVTWALIGDRKCRVVYVPCTKEQFEAYMRPIWREQKKEQRESKCMVPGKDGRLVRCRKTNAECAECPYSANVTFEENKSASLTYLTDEGAEPVVDGAMEANTVASILFDQFNAMVTEVNTRYGDVFRLLYDGKTQAQIAEALHMKPRTVSDDVRRIRAILQPVAKDAFGK